MHLFAPEVGMMGTSGIVGPCILQAAGAGYSFKLLESDRVAVAFFGDGAVNNGAFHEGLNMASIWKLPVLFVCENNEFATEVPFQYASGNPSVAGRAEALRPARDRGRRQRRPGRLRGRARGRRPRPARRRRDADRVQDLSHPPPRRGDGRLHVPDARGRRALEDPLPDPAAPPASSSRSRSPTRPSSHAIDEEVEAQIVEALQFAESSPWPDPATAADHVYAEPAVEPSARSPSATRRRRPAVAS